MDPRFNIDTHSENVVELLFNGLVRVNESLEIVPDLAESFEMLDALTYVFRLRKGIRFHDGSLLSAKDVVFTFQYLVDEKNASPYRLAFRYMKSVEEVDEHTVKVTLRQPYAFFLTAARRPIVPAKVARKLGKDFKKNPIGTGPYKLEKNDERGGVKLVAFKDYFRGPPKNEGVHIRPILDAGSRILELMKGTVDIVQNTASGFSPGSLTRLSKDPSIRIMRAPSTNVQYLNMNFRHPALKDLRVRQAIAHAIHREEIIQYKLSGFAKPASGILPPAHWAYEKDVASYAYDPGKSKALLKEAGGASKLVYKTSTNPQSVEIAQVIADQLRAVGFTIELRSMEFGSLFEDIKKGNFDIYTLQWTSVLIPDHYYDVFHSKSVPPNGYNRNFYANAKLDRLLEEGRKTMNLDMQKKIYSEAQKIVAEDLPCVPLWYPSHIAAIRKNVEGYRLHPRGIYTSLFSTFLKSP